MTQSTERVTALRFPVQAALAMPGSKSHTNRAIVCACLARGQTIIRNATPCDDVVVMVGNLQKMGCRIDWVDRKEGELKVIGGMENGPHFAKATRGRKWKMENDNESVILDCHNAGTTLRFLVSLATIAPGEWVITGDEHMRRRPIGDLVTALRSLGADIRDTNGCPPVTIRGGTLRGGSVRLRADVSSQFLTSLLLIAPVLKEGLKIELDGPLASSGYVDITEKVMKDFGVSPHPLPPALAGAAGRGGTATQSSDAPLKRKKLNTFFVQSSIYHSPSTYDIEGDWSAAGAWLILNELTGSRISLTNVSPTSAQSDRMLPDFIAKLRKRGDVTIDCSSVPDQVMNLAVLAAFRHGKTVITGVANLRHKECDRLAVITHELRKAGVSMTEQSDGLIIERNSQCSILNAPFVLDPHADHRMAMCFAMLGLLRGNIDIKDPQCVAKSYPQFFDHLHSVQSQSRPIAIIGMRGAGKSSLARRLASCLKLMSTDIDRVFESRNGPIQHSIADRGWAAFRRMEEDLIAESLQPGHVVSLGGGATESAKTRALLKRKAIVIWIQATKAELMKRLRSGKRPPLSDLPLEDEVQKLMVERGPHYREVATIIIESKLPFSRQVPFAVKELRRLVCFPSSPPPTLPR